MNELLNQTITCKTCMGSGNVTDDGKTLRPCPDCAGCGANFDNVIPDLLKEYFPNMERVKLPEIMLKIYEHINSKLVDSYERGCRDGVYAAKKEMEEKMKLENKEGENAKKTV